jgi:transmembrane sensor
VSPSLEDIAAEWAVKVDAGPLNLGEEAALAAWLEAAPRHAGAFARARAALQFATPERLIQVRDEFKQRPAPHTLLPRRQMIIGGAGLAAAASIMVGVSVSTRLFGSESYATRIGETQIVPLADGSVVTLNTNSKIQVHYTQERREIRLVQGEALFDVAKNKKRPFIVLAGGTQVRAVGTSFTVRMLPDQPVQVLVREGVVEVKHPDQPAATPVRLPANSRGTAPVDAPIVAVNVPQSEVTRALAWRVGRIAFEGEPLKQAAAEFDRYSDTHIEIDAPDIENQTVAGLFVSNDPVGFSRAVAASFNLHMTVSDKKVVLSR